jgi:hypothetical protein
MSQSPPVDRPPDLAKWVLEFAIGFWFGYRYIGPAIRDALGLGSGIVRPGRHRIRAEVISPPERAGCDCWCHRPADEWIGGV